MPRNKYRDTDNSIQPQTPYNPSPQGKLVLPNPDNKRSQRQPYQYPPRQPAPPPPPPYVRLGADIRPKRRRKLGFFRLGCITMLVLIAIVTIVGLITVPRVLAFGSAISATNQPPLSMSGDMSTNNRVNLLVMGYGGGQHDGSYLMDSLLVISQLPQSHHTSLVSVPRDLWVQNDPATPASKINALYTIASNNNEKPVEGGKAMTDEVSQVTGLDTKYWMTIDFTGFRALINSIGGIDVYVPDSFSANYPANDDPNVDASWKTVTFTKGNQHMDGETAIEYARARYVTDNLAEGTDFARSARQQIIMKAVMSKIKQISTWPKLFDALNALQDTIRTNMSFADLAQFALDMDLNSPKTAHIGLSVTNVLANGTSDDGQSILVPLNDWADVASYVQQHLYN